MIHEKQNDTKIECEVCEIEISTTVVGEKLCDHCKTWAAIGVQIDVMRKALREVA